MIKYLPPNNLGESIKGFESTATVRIQGGDEFLKKHRADIDAIANAENSINGDKKRKAEIDEEIKSFPDMAKKKERERTFIILGKKLHGEKNLFGQMRMLRLLQKKKKKDIVQKTNAYLSLLSMKSKQQRSTSVSNNFVSVRKKKRRNNSRMLLMKFSARYLMSIL